MRHSSEHPTEWTLEQLAEGSLPAEELAGAAKHVQGCTLCSAQVEAYRALFHSLAELPRFTPDPGFADAVMARVRVAPARGAAFARLRRWLPTTPRGWALLAAAIVAPALPLVALLAWVITHPLITPLSLWEWGTAELGEAGQGLVAALYGWSTELGLVEGAQRAYTALLSVPPETLGLVLAAVAVAIPLSAWALVRLVRTPMRNVTYAN